MKKGNIFPSRLLPIKAIIDINKASESASTLTRPDSLEAITPAPDIPKSITAVLNSLNALVGTCSAMSLNLPSNCPMIAALRAVSFSISESSEVDLFTDLAKSLYTVSRRIITPISSKISGSAFTIPRVKRSIASDIFLPKATEAALAPLVILIIFFVVNPAVDANAALVEASLKSNICPEAA